MNLIQKTEKKILKRYKEGKSVIGLKFKVGDKTYKVTDGNLNKVFDKIEKIKQDILNNIKK